MFNPTRLLARAATGIVVAATAWFVLGLILAFPQQASEPGATGPAVAHSRPPISLDLDVHVDSPVAAQGRRGRNQPAGPDATVGGPYTLGDDPVLDDLWGRCEAGDGAACDELFERSPLGSNYERFGLTCGDRPLVLDCTAELQG